MYDENSIAPLDGCSENRVLVFGESCIKFLCDAVSVENVAEVCETSETIRTYSPSFFLFIKPSTFIQLQADPITSLHCKDILKHSTIRLYRNEMALISELSLVTVAQISKVCVMKLKYL